MNPTPHTLYPVPFRVVVAFDDLAAGRQALALLAKLVEARVPRIHLVPILWRFEELEVSSRRRVALADGLAADLLIVSSSRSGELPRAVADWSSAVARSRRNVDLVTLFAGESWTVAVENTVVPAAAKSASVVIAA